MKKELIFSLVAILIAASAYCLADGLDSTKKVVKTGDIMGTAVNCDRKAIVNAEVFLNGMPDSILQSYLQAEGTLESPYTSWPMRVYKDQNITSTKTDSAGNFAFRNIPIGYYQVYCYAPNEFTIRDPSMLNAGGCAMAPIDYVRIAPDSLTRLSLAMSSVWTEGSFQKIWYGEVEPKKGANDENKQK